MIKIERGEDYLLTNISGYDFVKALGTVKDMPCRVYDKRKKIWMIPLRDLGLLYKNLKKKKIHLDVPDKIRKEYDQYCNWYQNQTSIKNTKEPFTEMDTLTLPLYPYQTIGSKFIENGGSGIIADWVGLGKTPQSLSVVEKHFRDKKIDLCIIICPSTLKRNWFEEIKKFTIRSAFDTTAEKKKRQSIYQHASNGGCYIVFNYEIIVRDFDYIMDTLVDKNIDRFTLIIDEIQYIKNTTPKRSKRIKEMSKYAYSKIGLSATPIENNITDLWSEMQAIDHTVLGGDNSWTGFANKFVKVNFWGEPSGYKNQEQFKKRIAPCIIRRRKEEVRDELPKRIENNYWINLSPEQEKMYNDVEKKIVNGITDLEKAERISSAEIISLIIYLRQCVLSTQLVGYPNNISTKLDHLVEFVQELEAGTKIVIFCHFTLMVDLIGEAMKDIGLNTYAIHGKNCPTSKRWEIVDNFNNKNDIDVLVSSDILIEGMNMPNAHYIVNFDMLYNHAKMEQRVGRLDRITRDANNPINVINFIANDTVEVRMYDIWKEKREMSLDIMDNNQLEKRMTFRNIKNLLELV